MSELLLIDDDQELCELLSSWLSQEGFQVRACHDGNSARQALADQAPSAVVLDVMLPDGSGLELLKQLRSEHPDLPVVMLSARGEPLDRILGLELGADDYLAKPCDPRELTARLRAVLRRSHPVASSTQLELGDLTFSPMRGVVSIDEKELTLTVSESRLLDALLRQPGEPLDKQELRNWRWAASSPSTTAAWTCTSATCARKSARIRMVVRASWRCAAVATITVSERFPALTVLTQALPSPDRA